MKAPINTVFRVVQFGALQLRIHCVHNVSLLVFFYLYVIVYILYVRYAFHFWLQFPIDTSFSPPDATFGNDREREEGAIKRLSVNILAVYDEKRNQRVVLRVSIVQTFLKPLSFT